MAGALAATLLVSVVSASTPAPCSPTAGSQNALAPAAAERLLIDLMSVDAASRQRAAERLLAECDPGRIPALVDALFFTRYTHRSQILSVLRALAAEDAGDGYWEWVELLGRRQELIPSPGYRAWKTRLLTRIDPTYEEFFGLDLPEPRLRLAEVVTGGVRLDGIPALERPDLLAAGEAGWLTAEEPVFGVALGGEARAYPLRIVSWHEMVNDVVGGEPVTLSYCSLCRSGVLWSGRLPDGQSTTFGTSGLLYRSNKLMYDRASRSLWIQLTGDVVAGQLADRPRRLNMLPMTLTSWASWRQRHPDTTVLSLRTGLEEAFGYDYRPGAADRHREGVSFPAGPGDERLARDRPVYGLAIRGETKAYPVDAVLRQGVVHDRLGGEEIVLVGVSGAIRAYRSGGHRFRLAGDGELLDERRRRWQVEEWRLAPTHRLQSPAATASLERLPGVVAAWFGWSALHPRTRLWNLPSDAGK